MTEAASGNELQVAVRVVHFDGATSNEEADADMAGVCPVVYRLQKCLTDSAFS